VILHVLATAFQAVDLHLQIDITPVLLDTTDRMAAALRRCSFVETMTARFDWAGGDYVVSPSWMPSDPEHPLLQTWAERLHVTRGHGAHWTFRRKDVDGITWSTGYVPLDVLRQRSGKDLQVIQADTDTSSWVCQCGALGRELRFRPCSADGHDMDAWDGVHRRCVGCSAIVRCVDVLYRPTCKNRVAQWKQYAKGLPV
jgi:hypothetical protein